MTGNNSYTGPTVIHSGVLEVGVGTAGTLGTGEVFDNGVLTFDRSDAFTVANAISGTGSVRVFGGTTILTGDNTYSGGTKVFTGKLEVQNTSTTSAVGVLGGNVVVDSGAALVFNNAELANNGYVIDGVISGAGAVDFLGPTAPITTLNVANSYTGGTTISSGIVDLSNNGALGKGPSP